VLDNYNAPESSQWDGLAHAGHIKLNASMVASSRARSKPVRAAASASIT